MRSTGPGFSGADPAMRAPGTSRSPPGTPQGASDIPLEVALAAFKEQPVPSTAEIRAWARKQGRAVSRYGPLPADVRRAWDEAHIGRDDACARRKGEVRQLARSAQAGQVRDLDAVSAARAASTAKRPESQRVHLVVEFECRELTAKPHSLGFLRREAAAAVPRDCHSQESCDQTSLAGCHDSRRDRHARLRASRGRQTSDWLLRRWASNLHLHCKFMARIYSAALGSGWGQHG